jgi:hypothetical protein
LIDILKLHKVKTSVAMAAKDSRGAQLPEAAPGKPFHFYSAWIAHHFLGSV